VVGIAGLVCIGAAACEVSVVAACVELSRVELVDTGSVAAELVAVEVPVWAWVADVVAACVELPCVLPDDDDAQDDGSVAVELSWAAAL
jgi:hypothetical protein